MKKYFFLLTALFLTSFAFAQTEEENIDLIQKIFGMEKKQVVADFVTPSENQSEAFWKVYDEYEVKRKELGKERIELLKIYAAEYLTMTSEQADDWTKQVIALQKKTDNLIVTYYDKVKNVSDGIVATQFYQIESYVLTYVRMHLLQDVPFVKK